ncbi:MAG: tRNA threonylcarbamoyladenosine dehydratase [Erysipelotrichaceae bacterium]|nr:tRNA threonylcarbamoyladenosine dehydratase [Erysipelotrichaceae bacterium]
MSDQLSRTKLIYGEKNIDSLKDKTVAVFGIGGVGCYVVEALTRAGIGHFVLVDNDEFTITNLNRQLYANKNTIGKSKVDVAKENIISINEEAIVDTYKIFYLDETKDQFDFGKYDYVIDAIDTVSGKLSIIEECKKCDVPVISCLGTGNRIDPSKLKITDIHKTDIDPLAKVMRKECRNRGIKKLKVLCSDEKPIKPLYEELGYEIKGKDRPAPGSTPFVPSCAGIMIAAEVIKDLLEFNEEDRK